MTKLKKLNLPCEEQVEPRSAYMYDCVVYRFNSCAAVHYLTKNITIHYFTGGTFELSRLKEPSTRTRKTTGRQTQTKRKSCGKAVVETWEA